MIDTELKNKVAIITGTNNPMGIGAACARALAREEAKIVLHFHRIDPEANGLKYDEIENAVEPGLALYYKNQTLSAEILADEIIRDGGQVTIIEADLADERMISLLFDRTEETYGPADILINNAAYFKADTFLSGETLLNNGFVPGDFNLSTITGKSHDRHFEINSRATTLSMAEYAKRYMKHGLKEGCIVNISTDGASGSAGSVSYGASKNAMESYSRAAAHELAKYGIRINVIAPGPVQTGWISKELESGLTKQIPLKRIGRPEDIANAAVFLCSRQSEWITGQVICVGGGCRM